MNTLLLRLAAPLQAWGTDSRYDHRKTDRIPSKSGVIGLLAAALGYKRDADLTRLSALSFGVRVEREGQLLRDFHTAKSAKSSYVTYRYYLTDAVFLVGFESENTGYLQEIDYALRNPVYPLFLGRRSCPPTLPLSLGIRQNGLKEALQNEPRLTSDITPMRIVTDASEKESGIPVRDLPVSFNSYHREYEFRSVLDLGYVAIEKQINIPIETEHDIFAELGE